MPYCPNCSADCELINIESTPSPHMKQGDCAKCHNKVFFFSDISLEVATPADAPPSAPLMSPTSSKIRPTLQDEDDKALTDPTILTKFMENPRLYLMITVGAIVLLIAIISLMKKITTPDEPLRATAQVESDYISITNNNSFTWSDVKLTLNGTYAFTKATKSLPSNGTCYFAFSQFVNWSGHAFTPTNDPPKLITINAKDSKNRSGEIAIEVKAKE